MITAFPPFCNHRSCCSPVYSCITISKECSYIRLIKGIVEKYNFTFYSTFWQCIKLFNSFTRIISPVKSLPLVPSEFPRESILTYCHCPLAVLYEEILYLLPIPELLQAEAILYLLRLVSID